MPRDYYREQEQDYDEHIEIETRLVMRPRKDYVCGNCGRPLLKGEPHKRLAYLDGDLRLRTARIHRYWQTCVYDDSPTGSPPAPSSKDTSP